jgi:cystine transport system substrate-binding protein
MNDLPRIDERLSATLRRYADSALGPYDAMAIAREASARAARHHGAVVGGRIFRLLAAAALLLATAAAAYVGSQLVEPQPDLLTRIRLAGSVRIAVRPDFPQVVGRTVGLDGFDVDVAAELAYRLGIAADVRPSDAEDMLSQPGQVDLLLPSVQTTVIDPDRFARSVPYYWWPHYLVVEAWSGRRAIDDLAGQSVCAVGGDMGEAWLRGQGGPMPIERSVIVSRKSDAECMTALADGEVAGLVTARMGPADLAARPTLTVLPGPPSEPRVVVAALASRPGSLLAEVDAALGDMLTDGTLARHSKNRFGGYDLTRSTEQE